MDQKQRAKHAETQKLLASEQKQITNVLALFFQYKKAKDQKLNYHPVHMLAIQSYKQLPEQLQTKYQYLLRW